MSHHSLNEEVLAQGAWLVLETCAKVHPERLSLQDLRPLCKDNLVLPLQDYVGFLLRFGQLKLDQEAQQLWITLDGQRTLRTKKLSLLEHQARAHFKAVLSIVALEDEQSIEMPPGVATDAGAVAGTAGASDGARATPTRSTGSRQQRGTVGGRYQVMGVIGRGAVSTVYRASQLRMGREVAVKELDLTRLFSEPVLQKVVRSVARGLVKAAALTHPNIAVLLDGNLLKDRPYVVYELLPGGSLEQALAKNGTMPLETAVPVFLQCLNAVRHAHRCGVHHRNLKPSNILFDDSGNVQVTDFGMSPPLGDVPSGSEQRLLSSSSGSYLPPEILGDPSARDHQTDLYSLGVVLYEMLTGRLPGRRCPMPSELIPQTPPVIDQLFDRMTHGVPDKRFASADEVLEAFYAAEVLVDPRAAVLLWDDGAVHPVDNQLAGLESGEVDPQAGASPAEAVQLRIGRLRARLPVDQSRDAEQPSGDAEPDDQQRLAELEVMASELAHEEQDEQQGLDWDPAEESPAGPPPDAEQGAGHAAGPADPTDS